MTSLQTVYAAERGMLKNAAFHLGLYCLLTVISPPNEINLDINIPEFPKNGLTQLIRMGKSISHVRVMKVEGLYCLCSENRAANLCLWFFAYFKCRFYHDAAINWLIYHARNKIYINMSNDFQFCNTLMLLKIHDAHSKP